MRNKLYRIYDYIRNKRNMRKALKYLLKKGVIPITVLEDELKSWEDLYYKSMEWDKKYHKGNYTDVTLKIEGKVDFLQELLGIEEKGDLIKKRKK